MSVVTAESLKSELDMFDIAYESDIVLDKMIEQCICNRIHADEMVLEWVAYSSTKKGLNLTVETLERFEHEILSKRSKSKQSSRREETLGRTRDIHTLQELMKVEEEEDNLLDSYSTPAKGSQKRALTTPEQPQSKRSALLASPGLLLSPASFSPSSLTPSQKYSQRGGKGEVVVSFGLVQGTRWMGRSSPGIGVQLELLEGPEVTLTSSYKFMFQRLRDIHNVLTDKIEELGESLKSHFHIDEFSPVSLPAQDAITVLGQICCDSNGKLNAHSVLLEAGPEQGGQQIPVDLSELKEYSLFPGQVVAMDGMNTTGRKLVASKLHEGVPLPFYTPVKLEVDEEPLNVLVACGPFTPSDTLTYDPLLDLINVITRDRPDVCLLLGPFVDSKHEQIEKAQVTETFEAIFSRCIESIVDGTKSVGCRLVFVPSQRDIHHPFVYPQPPFTLTNFNKDHAQRVTLVPDPCTLLIDGVTFGLTSTDILFHMGAEEISSGAGSDRFSRILKHILTQRSYYPLYPPVEEVNMDYEKFQSYGQMPLTPDVLIIPSELRYFIKDVLGCVCVNPGRLTKGQVGGTYGRLLIQRSAPSEEEKRVSPCLAAQVVKI
ncbi:DNA polymerase alpha subunit B isoform X1 [Periophthalmus magnuspinnatus]|uniref:DNA polymerase alpha subunit B isoform X1 n=1 Tax=Periophthalmus magnuspinnatus TaxID=409849 RepID=UPI0024373359|nr:DNA polymerase alpha subunit B isoform X1 [Periophthalmus magnuspinnatus]